MLPVANIHVPASNPIGPVNLQIGIERGIWGWTDGVWHSPKARTSIQSLVLGQPILLVLGGPNPRTNIWTSEMTPFRQVAAGTITESAYEDHGPVWPDGTYPHRIRIKIHATAHDVTLDSVGSVNWEAIRHSGCAQGAPYVAESNWSLSDFAHVVEHLATSGASPGVISSSGASKAAVRSLEEASSFPADYETDREITTTARVEARYFRQRLIGNAMFFPCALCGRDLPIRLIVAAHIKKRSDCTDEEKKDPNVVMGNCLLGCDILYEIGAVTVTKDGVITQGHPRALPRLSTAATGALITAAGVRLGEKCPAFGPKNKSYFEWHYAKNGLDDA